MSPSYTRLEVDIRRLLTKCEEMAKEDNSSVENWRLIKFIETAEDIILQLKNCTCKTTAVSVNGKVPPDTDKLDSYMRRVSLLKGLMETKRMQDKLEKSIAVQMLAPPSALDSSAVKEIYQKNLSNCENDLRSELLEADSSSHLSLRQREHTRTRLTEPSGSQEMDSILKYHNVKHDQITTDMLSMTRSMKEQSELASRIIREDTKSLEKSSNIMDDNYHQLNKQSTRLQAFISSSGWRCWTWIMLAVIMTIFINIVFFMKVARKRS